MNNTKIYIDPRCRINYASFHIYGFINLVGKKNVIFSVAPFKDEIKYNTKQDYNQGFCIIAKNEKDKIEKKIYIDFEDDPTFLEDKYDWCDIYAKINLKKEDLSRDKVISVGPHFGISLWNKFSTFSHFFSNYLKSRKHTNISAKAMLKDYVYTIIRRRPYSKYQKETSSDNYVFSLSTLWYDNLTHATTNKLRGTFVKTCKRKIENFEGGFFYIEGVAEKEFDKYKSYKDEYKDYLYLNRISMDAYLEKTKKSAFVFNTPSVSGCHGWKLGEYMCMGKATISTPLTRELSCPLENNKHCIFLENESDFEEIIDRLNNEKNLRIDLENNLHNYYESHFAPVPITKYILSKAGIV